MHRVNSSSSINGATPGPSSSTHPTHAASSSSSGHTVFYPNRVDQAAMHSPHPQFYPNGQARPVQMRPSPDHMMGGMHEMPQGRLALPMQGQLQPQMHANGMPVMMGRRFSNSPSVDDGPFMPMSTSGTPMLDMTSPLMGHMQLPYHQPAISPTDEMRQHQNQLLAHAGQRPRPGLQPRHSLPTVPMPPRPLLSRQTTLQVPPTARSASPHIMPVGDVFDADTVDSPVPRPSSSLGLSMSMGHAEHQAHMQQQEDMFFGGQPQGITPSRALGPAPHQPINFSFNALVTPNDKRGALMEPSSGVTMTASSSTARTDSSGSRASSAGRRAYVPSSDDEHESPTRPNANTRQRRNEPDAAGVQALDLNKPVKPTTRPTVIGGRTSAKFEKVAEDPGVEGVPPGPRSHERPGPSFACIIGQAILSCKAGGLSLEHIYRYVETAYPYFQKVDAGAWRNSVRHNLSIHKMFETIPRTEKYPPGKGGIWIIHEDEKCHWPSQDKFIKNFPLNHPHHHTCRQTLHEADKEKQAKEKAEREGRVYIPKKIKKPKKGALKEESESIEVAEIQAVHADGMPVLQPYQSVPAPAPTQLTSTTPHFMHAPLPGMPEGYEHEDFAPDPFQHHPPPPAFLIPALPQAATSDQSVPHDDRPMHQIGIAPPRFGSIRPDKRRTSFDGDENFFASSIKRPRQGDSLPLRPINPDSEQGFEDSFITPERERPGPSSSTMKMAHSSTFKTPALVNTSSSPGSSPMPPTLPRNTHNPSALQQAWTHDDMTDSTPPPPALEEAFDLKPKAPRHAIPDEDHFTPMAPPPTIPGGANENGAPACPITPLNKSTSGHKPLTPSMMLLRTPIWHGSPHYPGSTGESMSTPSWIMDGVLDRMRNAYGGHEDSPTSASASRSPRRFVNSPNQARNRTFSGSPRKIRDLIS